MNLKQTEIDTCSRHTVVKLVTIKPSLTAAPLDQMAERVDAVRVLTAARAVLALDAIAQPLAYGRAIHALAKACDSEPAPSKAEPEKMVHCDNCTWRGHESELRCDLASTPDLNERLDPGGEVPAGECPRCGCLAYIA